MSQHAENRGALPAQGETHTSAFPRRHTTARTVLLAVIAVVLVGIALRATVWVSMPVTFSVFIALALWPLDQAIRMRVPQALGWLGTAAAAGLLLVILAAFFTALWYAAAQVVSGFPSYAEDIADFWNDFAAQLPADVMPAGSEAANGEQVVLSIFDVLAKSGQSANVLEGAVGYAGALVNSVGNTLAFLVLIFFLVLLMLTDAGNWRVTIARIAAKHKQVDWSEVAAVVSRQFRWYLLVRTFLGAVTGLLYGLWLWAWGVDFVFVWGMLAFLLNYVPTIGSLIAGVLPIAFAFLQLDPWTALLVAAGILVIEQFMGNFVDTRLIGRELSLSPPVVLVALLFWSWLWGIGGALLAVPMTALIALVCSQIPRLQPLALLLAGAPRIDGSFRRRP